MPKHTREEVQAAISNSFGPELQETVRAALEGYGAAPSEPERERVQIAILDLSKGDLARLNHFVECAKQDYRDVLMWSEYPE